MENKKINLILADDHGVIRQALGEALEKKEHYKVVAQAKDGQELIESLEFDLGADIVIMDYSMPRLDGIEALQKIRAMGNKLPVLMLSALEGAQNVRAAIAAGANGYLPKNTDLDELEFAIKSVLSGKTYLSPSITTPLIVGNHKEDEAENSVNSLTKREKEIMQMLAEGEANRNIAKKLFISIRTVDTHRTNILKKLHVKTNVELAKIAIHAGLVEV
jgi:DNA-binding NarL/FixJ family response regulator